MCSLIHQSLRPDVFHKLKFSSIFIFAFLFLVFFHLAMRLRVDTNFLSRDYSSNRFLVFIQF